MNINKPLAALATALLIGSTPSVFAASTVDLTVTGLITPNACTPSLSAGGIIDHGKISAKDLNQNTPTQLPDNTLQLSVSCDAKTLFAIKGTDNRLGSSIYAFGYGLGLIDNMQKIGSFHLEYRSPVADTVPTTPMVSMDDGLTWHNAKDASIPPKDLAAFGDRSGGNGWAPIPIQELLTEVVVITNIAPANSLNLANEVRIDGSATLEVKYL